MVADLDRALASSFDVIEFADMERHDEFGLAILEVGEAESAMSKRSTVGVLEEAGAEMIASPIAQSWGLRDVGVLDPDGHQLGVCQRV